MAASGDAITDMQAYPCPYCHAPAGGRCTKPSGRAIRPHAARYWLWREALDAEDPPAPAPEGVWAWPSNLPRNA